MSKEEKVLFRLNLLSEKEGLVAQFIYKWQKLQDSLQQLRRQQTILYLKSNFEKLLCSEL